MVYVWCLNRFNARLAFTDVLVWIVGTFGVVFSKARGRKEENCRAYTLYGPIVRTEIIM